MTDPSGALVDLRAAPPPAEWGVIVDGDAIGRLAEQWMGDEFELPAFDYPGTPVARDESWWFDYVTLATSVLACLWPPEGDDVWHAEFDGEWLDDAPGIFAALTKARRAGRDLDWFATMSDDDGHALFAGRGTLQLLDERTTTLRAAAATILDRWSGTVANLVDAADRQGPAIVDLLIETMPGFHDRPVSAVGVLPFDKLAHLGAALMAAGVGWHRAGFAGFNDFPVYPDYMLPRVLRHVGVLRYSTELAEAVDRRTVVAADSVEEHAIRWATIYAAEQLRRELAERGNPVAAPALDYRLWHLAVLDPSAGDYGEHHRTVSMRY